MVHVDVRERVLIVNEAGKAVTVEPERPRVHILGGVRPICEDACTLGLPKCVEPLLPEARDG